MLSADELGGYAHGADLISEGVGPEVGQQQAAGEESEGAVASAPGSLHLCAADCVHVKLQDHDGEDDHAERKDQRRPRLHFTLVREKRKKMGVTP